MAPILETIGVLTPCCDDDGDADDGDADDDSSKMRVLLLLFGTGTGVFATFIGVIIHLSTQVSHVSPGADNCIVNPVKVGKSPIT